MAAQLALDTRWTSHRRPVVRRPADAPALCAACRAREARYGFRADEDDPALERPSTLCFECFRAEIARRQEALHTTQPWLPLAPRRVQVNHRDTELERTLESLSLRRRRAQIAARSALGLR
jgi:hypothetical protein